MKKIFAVLTTFVFFLGSISFFPVKAVNTNEAIRVVFTQNLNARLDEQLTVNEDDVVKSYGGYAYIASALDAYTGTHSLLVDAGNFAYGSLFSSLNNVSAPSLSLLNAMEYDAVALGNREFENGIQPLADMFAKVGSSPALLANNIELQDTVIAKQLTNSLNKLGGIDPVVINKRGVKFGVFSVIDDNCLEVESADAKLVSTSASAVEAVRLLESQDADIIVCLYQGGSSESAEKLARNVNGIDLLISAENGIYDEAAVTDNGTHIVSAGSNGQYIGVVEFDSNYDFQSFELVEVSENKFSADSFIRGRVETDISSLNSRFLNRYNYNFSKTIANSSFSTDPVDVSDHSLIGNNTGNVITDAYASEYERLSEGNTIPIAITDRSMVTGNVIRGNQTISTIFNLCGNGMSIDGTCGTPLVELFITGKDLVALAELDCSVFRDNPVHQLLFAHMRYIYSEDRQPMNRVEDVLVEKSAGYFIPVENDELYAVVMNEKTAAMIQREAAKAGHLIQVKYRNAEGILIADLPTHYIKNENKKVVYEWMAVARHLSEMERNSSNIPALNSEYKTSRKGKVLTNQFNITRYFKHLNSATINHYLKIFGIAVLLIGGIRILIWLMNRNKQSS